MVNGPWLLICGILSSDAATQPSQECLLLISFRFFLHTSFFERSLNTGNTDVNCSGKGSVMKFTPSFITNRFVKVTILYASRDVQGRKNSQKSSSSSLLSQSIKCTTEITCCSLAFITTLSCRIYYIDDIYINTFLFMVQESYLYFLSHQLLNLILLNISLHHNITQPPIPHICHRHHRRCLCEKKIARCKFLQI